MNNLLSNEGFLDRANNKLPKIVRIPAPDRATPIVAARAPINLQTFNRSLSKIKNIFFKKGNFYSIKSVVVGGTLEGLQSLRWEGRAGIINGRLLL